MYGGGFPSRKWPVSMKETCCQGGAFYLSFAANAPFSVCGGKLFLPSNWTTTKWNNIAGGTNEV
jgi:hypothetical protein